MINFLLNPFKKIAGGHSLLLGIIVMILTTLIAWFSNIHFPDIISLKTSNGLPLTYLLIQTFSNWLVISVLLYVYALIASPSAIRAIDIFGTQALARFPYLPGALIGFSGALEKFSQFIMAKAIQSELLVTISPLDMGLAVILIIFSMLMLVWLIALMYNAFSISANLKGAKAVFGFIIILMLSIAITYYISYQMFKLIN